MQLPKLEHMKIILICDDGQAALGMQPHLQALGSPVETYSSGHKAMGREDWSEVGVVLVWATLNDIPCLELLDWLTGQPSTRHLPVIVCCNPRRLAMRQAFLAAGAVDCLSIPAEPFELMVRTRNAMQLGWFRRQATATRRGATAESAQPEDLDLESGLEQAAMMFAEEAECPWTGEAFEILIALAASAEYKQGNVHGHLCRIAEYTIVLSRALNWFDALTDQHMRLAAPLHDIGKIGLPDFIQMKPGLLTSEEFEEMKRHTTIGADLLERCPGPVGTLGSEIARAHHERWDGTGYPHGLTGDEIPKSARIVALADAFDALQTHRAYRPDYPLEQCYQMIRSQAGKQFDPDVVEVFNICRKEIEEVAATWPNEAHRVDAN